MRAKFGMATILGVLILSSSALADEQMVPLAQDGSWVAFGHQDSMVDKPDICVAMDTQSNLALRSENGTIEIRLTNEDWSLPSGVKGNIEVKVGEIDDTFAIDGNTNIAVAADVDAAQLIPLLDALSKGSSMEIKVGNAAPITGSLNGSATAINAFRTCASIGGSASGGGTNPFQ